MESQTKKVKKSKPIGVLISDIHFNINTMGLADRAFTMAVTAAMEMNVPLYVTGDLNDTKAIIRGEVANCLISLFKEAKSLNVQTHVLVGNHDLLNEKGSAHSLNFLKPWTNIIDTPTALEGLTAIPYQTDSANIFEALRHVEKGSIVLMHQGVKGAFMGEYIKDRSSVDPALLADWRCISGHYHRHQTINNFTYVGSPYTISFAEAGDGPKGFQILFEDGSLELVPTNLRKHVIVERSVSSAFDPIDNLNTEDILWLKVIGPHSELEKLSKRELGLRHLGHSDFKFDKIRTDKARPTPESMESFTSDQILDMLITDSDEPEQQKISLKKLWREVMS